MPKRSGSSVYKQPDSKFWYINYRDPHSGKQVRVSSKTTSKEQAQELAAKLYSDAWAHRNLGSPIQWTVKELIDWAWEKKWSRAKNANRRDFDWLIKSVMQKFADHTAENVKIDDIESYINERLKNGYSVSTINREIAPFRSAYNLAIKADCLLRKNPFSNVDIFDESELKRDRTATKKEKDLLLGHCAGLLRDCIEFAFETGIDKAQIRKLQWSDINPETWQMRTVRYKRRGSGQLVRWIPLFPKAVAVLKRRPRISDFVFCNEVGDPIPKYGILHSSFQRLVERLEIPDFHFHDIRHTWATDYYRRTRDLVAVSFILGHTKIDTTIRYLNLSPADLANRTFTDTTMINHKIIAADSAANEEDRSAAILAGFDHSQKVVNEKIGQNA